MDWSSCQFCCAEWFAHRSGATNKQSETIGFNSSQPGWCLDLFLAYEMLDESWNLLFSGKKHGARSRCFGTKFEMFWNHKSVSPHEVSPSPKAPTPAQVSTTHWYILSIGMQWARWYPFVTSTWVLGESVTTITSNREKDGALVSIPSAVKNLRVSCDRNRCFTPVRSQPVMLWHWLCFHSWDCPMVVQLVIFRQSHGKRPQMFGPLGHTWLLSHWIILVFVGIPLLDCYSPRYMKGSMYSPQTNHYFTIIDQPYSLISPCVHD